MNQLNETVVNREFLKRLQDEGIDIGYAPVPDELAGDAEKLLRDRAIADMDEDMKRKLRNLNKRMRKEGVPGY